MADEATTPAENTDTAVAVEESPAEPTTPVVSGGSDVQAADTATDGADEKPEPKAETFDRAYVEKLRKEAADARVKGKEAAEKAAKDAAAAAEQAYTDKIGRALGLIKDDEPADPAELVKQAQQERESAIAAQKAADARLRAYELKDALTNAANKVDGDTAILIPYLKGEGALDKLDPTADDFASQVDALVKDAVDSNPKLKKTSDRVSAPRSGGDLSGGNAAPKPNGPKTVEEIRRERREKREREI